MITYLPHFVTAVLSTTTLILAGVNLKLTCKNTRRDILQILIIMAIGWQVATIIFFVFNQLTWVLKNHEQSVGSVDSTLWLLYDYSNLLFHLSSGLILYYFLSSRSVKGKSEESLLSGWTCPNADTTELDKLKARLDKLGQQIIPTVEINCEQSKGDKQ